MTNEISEAAWNKALADDVRDSNITDFHLLGASRYYSISTSISENQAAAAQAEINAEAEVTDEMISAATEAWINAKSELYPPSSFTVHDMLKAAFQARAKRGAK